MPVLSWVCLKKPSLGVTRDWQYPLFHIIHTYFSSIVAKQNCRKKMTPSNIILYQYLTVEGWKRKNAAMTHSLSLFHFCISSIILIYIPGITKINWQYIVENENSDDKDSNEDDNNKQKEQKIKFHFPKLLEDWPEQPEVSGLEERVCRRTKETSRNTCSRRELEGWVGYPNRDTKGKLDLIFFYLRKASLKI